MSVRNGYKVLGGSTRNIHQDEHSSCTCYSLAWLSLLILVTLGTATQACLKNDPGSSRRHQLTSPIMKEGWTEKCHIQLVESIPEGLVYNETEPIHKSTYEGWKELLSLAKERIDLASSYWSLRGKDVYSDPSDWQGEDIFKSLTEAATRKNIKIRIAQNLPDTSQPNFDTEELSKIQGIQVKSLNFSALMGNGILHTKLWIIDNTHFYVGSANFDWRSLTQVKEMGVMVTHCPLLAKDMNKIFEIYWALGGQGKTVPANWPSALSTSINSRNPLPVLDNTLSVYLSSSPPPFCSKGREVDIEAITRIIDDAQEFVHVAVMDYFPTTLYSTRKQFWPVIDDHLKKAIVERGVSVKLLLSNWTHTRPEMRNYLLSLTQLNGVHHNATVEGKMFKVPAFTPAQQRIPYARVNHNKYMVTDKTGFIGTSNWSADYFINTGGIGFIFTPQEATDSDIGQRDPTNLRQQLSNVFNRDWHSAYASEP